MKIVIPEIPPSLNRYAGRKNVYEYRDEKDRWKAIVAWLAKAQRTENPYEQATVRITYFFPDSRRRDPDNYAGKMILDGLTAAGVIADDDFFHINLEIRGAVDRKNPRTEVEVVPC